MATEFRDKTFHYARATFVRPTPAKATLQTLIAQAFIKLASMKQRSVKFKSGRVIQPRHQKIRTGRVGSLLHLVTFMEEEHATTVPHPKASDTEMDLSSAIPPDNEDFMDGEAFVLVTGNHAIVCSTSLSDSLICSYLDGTIQEAGLVPDPLGLSFERVADLNYIEMIKRFGVKSITLDASIYEAAEMHIDRKLQKGRILGEFYEQLQAMISKDDPVSSAVEHANLLTKVTIRLPGRTRGRGAQRALENLTENVLTEDGEAGVEIELGNDVVLSSKHVTLKKSVRVVALHKGLSHHDAFDHLDQYLKELRADNLLEK